MTKREAYQRGKSEGFQLALNCEPDTSTEHDTEHDGLCEWREHQRPCAECIAAEAFECEQVGRQMASSPFCDGSFVHLPESRIEGVYDAYDAGVAAGIKAGVKARLAQQPVRQ